MCAMAHLKQTGWIANATFTPDKTKKQTQTEMVCKNNVIDITDDLVTRLIQIMQIIYIIKT